MEGSMGESSEGSSSAAQSALEDENEIRPTGIWGRIIGALSPTETGQEDAAGDETQGVRTYNSSVPGMMNLRKRSGPMKGPWFPE